MSTFFPSALGGGEILLGSVDVLIRSTIVLLSATLACLALQRNSAAFRHRVWVAALGLCMALPVAAAVMPRYRLLGFEVGPAIFAGSLAASSPLDGPPSRINGQLPLALMIGTVWAIGVVVHLVWLLVALARQAIQLRRLKQVDDDQWDQSMQAASRTLRLQRAIRSLESNDSAVPAVYGVLTPKLVIPATWRSWSESQRQCVLLHELAHVQRRDVAAQLLARIAVAVYWFHPLVWFASSRLRVERELACDDCAVQSGQRPSSYATELLRTLRECRTRRQPLGVGMAHAARIDRRVVAILDPARCRRPVSRGVGLGCWAASVALCGALTGLTLASPNADTSTMHPIAGEAGEIPRAAIAERHAALDSGVEAEGEILMLRTPHQGVPRPRHLVVFGDGDPSEFLAFAVDPRSGELTRLEGASLKRARSAR